MQCSKHGDLASSQRIVEQFCDLSFSRVDCDATTSVASTSSATMFFKSSENTCCGSVTIKSELYEPDPAVSGTYPDAKLQAMDGLEKQEGFYDIELPFETPSYDLSFVYNGHCEVGRSSHASHELDVCSRRLPSYPSCYPDVVPLSVDTASLGTVLTPSELPAPVRHLLTPPDSVPNSPHSDEESDEMMFEEVVYPSARSHDDAPSSPGSGGHLVLTPVTRRPRRTHPGCTTIKYNRKNSPQLDHRRVHFCDFPG